MREKMNEKISNCMLCPRKCGVDRNHFQGFCKVDSEIRVARAALHYMEEPCISGKNGSGTVFFSGCNLKCCFCQNYQLSHENFGRNISVERLGKIFLELQMKGANNINLVTGTMYVPMIIEALDIVKDKINIPIVYNCGGYENMETIKMLEGYVDIYLQDMKYYDNELAIKYSNAPQYFEYASIATKEMIRQRGKPIFYDKKGEPDKMMKSGVIIRHLVLPGGRKDSMKILEWMHENLEKGSYLISLMSQYTPFYKSKEFKEINRLVTSFEYDSVVNKALELSIDEGYMQNKSSANDEYIPDFNLEGV